MRGVTKFQEVDKAEGIVLILSEWVRKTFWGNSREDNILATGVQSFTKRAAIKKLVDVAETLTDEDFQELSTAFNRARVAEFQRMIFRDKNPTKTRLNRWLASVAGEKLPSPTRVNIVRAIRHYRGEFNSVVYYDDAEAGELVPCTVIAAPQPGTDNKSFRVLESGGDNKTLHANVKVPAIVLE